MKFIEEIYMLVEFEHHKIENFIRTLENLIILQYMMIPNNWQFS